jgi:hypothetical protein
VPLRIQILRLRSSRYGYPQKRLGQRTEKVCWPVLRV